MNLALKQWQEAFAREPVTALDRLVRGLVSLGAAGQLSLGEILSRAFAPGDAALDAAVREWFASHILQPLPVRMTPARWAALLDELFRGIATMRLTETGRLLRDEHTRLRLWLRGLYAGPDRDPEGSYLLALAYHQADQKFSRLWRRLVLGEEMPSRPWRDLGFLGFRKLPDAENLPAADVPVGLLQAVAEWAERPGTSRDDWRHAVRSIFAAYRSTENYWVRKFHDILNEPELRDGRAAEWLAGLLPSWRNAQAQPIATAGRAVMPVTKVERERLVARITESPNDCDAPEVDGTFNRYRAYAFATGQSEYLVKTFNNLASRVLKSGRGKTDWAISRIHEAMEWEPHNPFNWTVYAQALWKSGRRNDALEALWQARQRFPWNTVVRNELTRLLREQGDLLTALAVCREAASHFPAAPYCRSQLGETLREMDGLEEARTVFEQACRDFPNEPHFIIGLAETLKELEEPALARGVYERALTDFPNNGVIRCGFGSLLLKLDDLDGAEKRFTEACVIDRTSQSGRYGIAEIMVIRSARANDVALRDAAREKLQQLADEGYAPARERIAGFDQRWRTSLAHGGVLSTVPKKPRTSSARLPALVHPPSSMSSAERLGRAMIALWHGERAATERVELCNQAALLLDLSESELGELLPGYVETRGLVMLARGDAHRALDYFTNQINQHGRGGWLGIRLGEQRARLSLGEPADLLPDEPSFDSRNARFALRVVGILNTLAKGSAEQETAELLRQLYPEAKRLAEQWATASQTSSAYADAPTEAASMMAAAVFQQWFHPARINSPDDFADTARFSRVIESISQTKLETLDVLSTATVTLAA